MINSYDALEIYRDIDATVFERRERLSQLLKDSNVDTQYKEALTSFVKQTRTTTTANEAESVVDKIVNSDEMKILDRMILAIVLFLLYGNGPKNHLVPVAYLPGQNYVYG